MFLKSIWKCRLQHYGLCDFVTDTRKTPDINLFWVYDDVMTCKSFPYTGDRWIPLTNGQWCGDLVFPLLVVGLDKLLSKKLSCRWLKTPWRNVTAMLVTHVCDRKLIMFADSVLIKADLSCTEMIKQGDIPWWRHKMGTFSVSLAICAGNSPVTGEFPSQRPVTWSFNVLFDLRLNKRLSKQSWGW